MNRFKDELKVISSRAWMAAALLGFGIPAAVFGYLIFNETRGDAWVGAGPLAFEVAIGVAVAVTLFVYILILGYILGDAERRGMRPFLWLLISVLIPSGIGIVLYFIVRQPVMQACLRCGSTAPSGVVFCTRCGAAFGKACGSCKGILQPDWTHCGHCGAPVLP